MRFRDILGLACSFLYQQKLRTALATLGVFFGAFVLVASFALALGVQETIQREYSRFGDLRRITVHQGPGKQAEGSAQEVTLPAGVSETRRERLGQEIRHRAAQDRPWVGKLTPALVAELSQMEHVRSVIPQIQWYGKGILNQKIENALMHTAPADHANLRGRVFVGEFFASSKDRTAVVSEYFLYRLGIIEDAAVQATLGKTLRMEFATGTSKPSLLRLMFNAGKPSGALDEERLLEKVTQQLPAALDQLDLTPRERTILRQALTPAAKPEPRHESVTLAEDFTIVGVVRASSPEEEKGRFDWWTRDADVFLPCDTATELFFRVPLFRQEGLYQVIVEVDDADHVKEINRQIAALGLPTHSLVELIEREQFIFLVIFGAMNVVAGIALLVSALGITNTMLMSVLERTREIGVMKAVGARDRQVQAIFLVEGALIGLIGGLLGLACSWAFTFPADAWIQAIVRRHRNFDLEGTTFAFPWWLILAGPLFPCLVTTLAALLPARRATKVNPIEALRHE